MTALTAFMSAEIELMMAFWGTGWTAADKIGTGVATNSTIIRCSIASGRKKRTTVRSVPDETCYAMVFDRVPKSMYNQGFSVSPGLDRLAGREKGFVINIR